MKLIILVGKVRYRHQKNRKNERLKCRKDKFVKDIKNKEDKMWERQISKFGTEHTGLYYYQE